MPRVMSQPMVQVDIPESRDALDIAARSLQVRTTTHKAGLEQPREPMPYQPVLPVEGMGANSIEVTACRPIGSPRPLREVTLSKTPREFNAHGAAGGNAGIRGIGGRAGRPGEMGAPAPLPSGPFAVTTPNKQPETLLQVTQLEGIS